MKIELLHQEDNLIVVNKPAGLLVIPDRFNTDLPCLKNLLETRFGEKIFVVHRLDKDTSGVICFARNEATHRHLSQIFQDHIAEKYYTGLVHGHVIREEGRIETPIVPHPTIKGKMTTGRRGSPAITEYTVVAQWSLYSLLQLRIHTGRTHQIRVHMQSLGHSIVCDPLYGDGQPFFLSSIKRKYKLGNNEENERPLLSRLALHAARLSLPKENGDILTVEAPLPKDMTACISQLNKWTQNTRH